MGNTIVNLPLAKSGYVRQEYPGSVFPTNSSTVYYLDDTSSGAGKWLYLGFSHLSGVLRYRRIYDCRLRVQCGENFVTAYACKADFTPSSLRWDNKPGPYYTDYRGLLRATYSPSGLLDRWFSALDDDKKKTIAPLFLYNYACFLMTSATKDATANGAKIVLSGGGTPYLEVTLDDSICVKSKITVRSAPTSGYVNPRNTSSFSWGFDRLSSETYYCAETFVQSSAALKWKTSGSDTWNTINASGSTQSLTVPANTFPAASTIEWYLTGTDTAGTSSESTHYTFSTAAGTAYANLISPVGSVEDGSKQIRITWDAVTTDGQAPSYVDLWWKLPATSEQNWTSILSHATWKTSHTMAAGVFPAGECQIALRAYNVDDVAGPWFQLSGNNWPSFICVAAPNAPAGLQATSVPRTTISWQATGQEAFEIEVDGEPIVKQYSQTTYQYRCDEPLSDGEHTIRVRIQGVYGLWSAWASVTVDIANNPPSTLVLSGRFDVDAFMTLEISNQPEAPIIQWYRDGVRIAQTHGPTTFTDRTVLGEHSWHAEMWYNTGNYSRSNVITGILKSCETRIADLAYGSSWLTLNLSENSNSVQNFNWSRASNLRHVRGSAFPVLEMGESEDLTGSYECAFKDVQTARKLEALKGKVVIVKSRGGQVLIGALTKLQKRMKEFYITYSFSIQQIHWEDMVYYDQAD